MADAPTPQDEIREAVAQAIAEFTGFDWRSMMSETDAVITAYQRALADAGLVIVPREASEGMIEAGMAEEVRSDEKCDLACEYRAMVAKAEEEMGNEIR